VTAVADAWSVELDARFADLLGERFEVGTAELELIRATGALQLRAPLAPVHAVIDECHLVVAAVSRVHDVADVLPVAPGEFDRSRVRPVELRLHRVRVSSDGFTFLLHRGRTALVRPSRMAARPVQQRFARWCARWLTDEQRAALRAVDLPLPPGGHVK